MKHTPIRSLLLNAGAVGLVLLAAGFGFNAKGQNGQPNGPPPGEVAPDVPNQQKPELGQLLNLSPEQRQQIAAVNQETALEFRRARQRMQLAQEELDTAVYSDIADQDLVATKIRQFVQAQGEFVRLRTQREFRIRQLLTPEQLARVREIRDQAKQRADELRRPNQVGTDGLRPNQRRRLQQGDGTIQPGQNFRQKRPVTTTPVKRP